MRKTNILIILGISLAIAGVSSLNFNINVSINDGDMEIWDETNLKIAEYLNLTGSPIFIDDADPNYNWSKTTADNDWCNGSGTINDPYIIEYVWIDGENTVGRVIEIRNSNVYFIIRNCFVTNSAPAGDNAGIFLYNTNNSQLINNDVSNNNGKGISLNDDCNNNTVLNNIANNNRVGVGLITNCDNNTVSDNILNQNRYRGIYLFNGCDNNTISGNTANDGGDHGIEVAINCNDNIISGNTVNSNGDRGIYVHDQCDYNLILGNTANGNSYDGIWIRDESKDNIVSGNIANNNMERGITISLDCASNTLTGNTANDNDYYGILLSNNCINNTVSNNIVTGNSPGGIHLWNYCDDNNLSGNLINDNNENGIYFYNSDNNIISGNIIYYNTLYGVLLDENCDGNLVYLNAFIGNLVNAFDTGTGNQWDNGIFGNYWDNYSGSDHFPMDGIGDTPHSFPVDKNDTKPIMDMGWDTDGDTFLDSDEASYGTNALDASWYPMPNLKVSHLSSVIAYNKTSFIIDFSITNNGIWKAEGVIFIVRCEELDLTLFDNTLSPLTLDVDETEYIAINCPPIGQTGIFTLSVTVDPYNNILETYSSKDGSLRPNSEDDNSMQTDLTVITMDVSKNGGNGDTTMLIITGVSIAAGIGVAGVIIGLLLRRKRISGST